MFSGVTADLLHLDWIWEDGQGCCFCLENLLNRNTLSGKCDSRNESAAKFENGKENNSRKRERGNVSKNENKAEDSI